MAVRSRRLAVIGCAPAAGAHHGERAKTTSDPATIERVAAIINTEHLTPRQVAQRNPAGWDLGDSERVTPGTDALHEAYALSMLMHAVIDPPNVAASAQGLMEVAASFRNPALETRFDKLEHLF